ncbi:hypothetical protein M758_10G065900 [Ceratodon purpureus]|nr:hypothetical protein M758_10G065900 [Ceratodon purpureus]
MKHSLAVFKNVCNRSAQPLSLEGTQAVSSATPAAIPAVCHYSSVADYAIALVLFYCYRCWILQRVVLAVYLFRVA